MSLNYITDNYSTSWFAERHSADAQGAFNTLLFQTNNIWALIWTLFQIKTPNNNSYYSL